MESQAIRRRMMQAVKSKDTAPELTVRRMVHGMGYRFRLYRSDLPGKPDLAFPRLQRAIFVHGCFWHGHNCLRGARAPKTNREYWTRKIERNQARDQAALAALKDLGWKVKVLWECEIKDEQRLHRQLAHFLAKAVSIADNARLAHVND